MKMKQFFGALASIAIAVCATNTINAQTFHTIKAQYGVAPAGPNSNFTVNLTMIPADINISGFGIRVHYDNTKIRLTGVNDNTGQPGAAVLYDRGTETAQATVSNTNVYVIVNMSTLFDLVTPTNLGQLNFTTTATYNDPPNSLTIVLSGQPPSSGGLSDSSIRYIPTNYENITPNAAASDWAMYY